MGGTTLIILEIGWMALRIHGGGNHEAVASTVLWQAEYGHHLLALAFNFN